MSVHNQKGVRYQWNGGWADRLPPNDPWRILLSALIARYGPEIGHARYDAQRIGVDPDVRAWKRLGKRAVA